MNTTRRRDDVYTYQPLHVGTSPVASSRGMLPPPSGRPHQHQHAVAGKASGSWAEAWVGELTQALPMRAAFYHHVAFAVLTSQLPRLHFDLCEPIPSGVGWACMGACALMAVGYSFLVEGNVLWALFSLLVYAIFAYASTPQFFSCYDAIYDPTVSRYLVAALLVILGALKVSVGVWKWWVKRNGHSQADYLRNLNTLDDDLEVYKTDM